MGCDLLGDQGDFAAGVVADEEIDLNPIIYGPIKILTVFSIISVSTRWGPFVSHGFILRTSRYFFDRSPSKLQL
jgi:hypothetical protein